MKLLFVILSLVWGTSVTTIQDQGDRHLPSIPVNVKENHRLKLSDIAEEVRKIEPEFNEESVLGRVRKVQVYNDSIFVLDQYDNLLVFDNKGKYSRQIGRPWKSRSLGSNFSDFTIDDKDGSVYISTANNESSLPKPLYATAARAEQRQALLFSFPNITFSRRPTSVFSQETNE